MKHIRVFVTVMCSVYFFISLGANVFSAEYQKDEKHIPVQIQTRTPEMGPDLSCYFSKDPNGQSIWIFVKNNTPVKANNFSVHVESIRDGVKVYDHTFSNKNLLGNTEAPLDLGPCSKKGQKFTGVVDSGESIVETNENNNTCEYICGYEKPHMNIR